MKKLAPEYSMDPMHPRDQISCGMALISDSALPKCPSTASGAAKLGVKAMLFGLSLYNPATHLCSNSFQVAMLAVCASLGHGFSNVD